MSTHAPTPHFLRVAASLALVTGSIAGCAASTGGNDGGATSDTATADAVTSDTPTTPGAVPCSSATVANQLCGTVGAACPPEALSNCTPTYLVCQSTPTGDRWQSSGCAEGPLPPPELDA